MEDSGVDSQDSEQPAKVLGKPEALTKPVVEYGGKMTGFSNDLFPDDSDSHSETEEASFRTTPLIHSKSADVKPYSKLTISPVSTQPRSSQHRSSKKYTGAAASSHERHNLLVDVPMSERIIAVEFIEQFEEDLPLNWQSSNRARNQLLHDGYDLDLQSDNEDLDLIPPKPQAGFLGGVCSCSSDGCVIS